MTNSSSRNNNSIYNIRLNSSGPPPVSGANNELYDPTAALTSKNHIQHQINYHESAPGPIPLINVVLLGGYGVGKTSLMDQFTEKHQPGQYRSTKMPQENKYRCTFTLDARRVYNLSVSDTEGMDHEDLQDRQVPSIHGSKEFAYLVVFSLAHYSSFKLAESILQQLVVGLNFDADVPIVLVGNKSDMPRANKDKDQRYITDDKDQTDCQQWDAEQDKRERDAFDFYDPETHNSYRQVQQADAWQLASRYNVKYKEVTAKCYADIVNVFVEVVTQRDKINDHRRRMEIDADNRASGEAKCDFFSTSPQKRRKYLETMKLEHELRIRELETRHNLGFVKDIEFRREKGELDSWMTNLKQEFNRFNSMGCSMYPHIREMRLIEGRSVREPKPKTKYIAEQEYPKPAPLGGSRRSKEPSTSSEQLEEKAETPTIVAQKPVASSTSISSPTRQPANPTASVSNSKASKKKTKQNNTPPAAVTSSSNSSAQTSPNKNATSSSGRTRNSSSTNSRSSPSGSRRRRSDSQGSFRTLSGVLDLFKNFPDRIMGKVS